MEENIVIKEEFTLPSKGLIYNKKVNPIVKLRSMTTEDEMKRLGASSHPYKVISQIIDDCMLEDIGISSYDMCIGDYQFLLHKLRIVTYGTSYKMTYTCPYCGKVYNTDFNLEDLEVVEYDESMEQYLDITLPTKQTKIKLRLQTPRMLDEVQDRLKDFYAKTSDKEQDPAILFTLMQLIEKIDGEIPSAIQLENFIRKLPMRDTNFILKNLDKVNIGITPVITKTCDEVGCERMFKLPFSITSEFYGPSI